MCICARLLGTINDPVVCKKKKRKKEIKSLSREYSFFSFSEILDLHLCLIRRRNEFPLTPLGHMLWLVNAYMDCETDPESSGGCNGFFNLRRIFF